MNGRFLDQILGGDVFDVAREDVLSVLRGHVLGTIVIERENPDGSTGERVQGSLVEASRDPQTWEHAEVFAVVSSTAALAWHNVGPRWEAILTGDSATPAARRMFAEAAQPPTFTFGVPEAGLVQYLGPDAGSAGFRWPLEDGRTLAVVLWQDVMHVTEPGDSAPGLGGVMISIGQDDDKQ